MAGHSKWANIKHRKERSDRKKGKIFSRIIKEIMSAVKQGGPDPKSNTKLKMAIQKAKENNVPGENVERNIKKASSSEGSDYIEMSYELYGYGGVGLVVDIMTDNKNRISSDIRIAINKCGGTVATPGAVVYNFERKGVIRVVKDPAQEEALFLLVSEAGADDFLSEEEQFTILTPVDKVGLIRDALVQGGYRIESVDLEMIPKAKIETSEEDMNLNIALIEWLENLDDVDAVFHNMA